MKNKDMDKLRVKIEEKLSNLHLSTCTLLNPESIVDCDKYKKVLVDYITELLEAKDREIEVHLKLINDLSDSKTHYRLKLLNLQSLIDNAELPEKKEETETCTKCGGLGKRPNHPHIVAHTCERCKGRGKVDRNDYKYQNQIIDQARLVVAKQKQEIVKWKEQLDDNAKTYADEMIRLQVKIKDLEENGNMPFA